MAILNVDGAMKNGQLIADFEDSANWTTSGSTADGATIGPDTESFHSGTKSLKLSCIGTGYVYAYYFFDQPIDLSMLDVFSLWVKWKRMSTGSVITILLSSDNTSGTFSNYAQFTSLPATSISGLRGDGGPICISWNKTNATFTGTINWSNIRNIRIRLNCQNATGETVNVDQFTCGRIPRPVAIVTYDDSVQSADFDMMARSAEATALGIPITHFTAVDHIGLPGYLTLAQLHELQNRGDLIAAHTAESFRYVEDNSTEEQAYENMLVMRDWLKVNGFRGHEYYAWHGGQYYNGDVSYIESARLAGFKISRSIKGTLVARGNVGIEQHHLGVIEPMVLNARALSEGLATALADIDRVIKEGGVACTYSHWISTGALTPTGYEITGNDWLTYLQYLAAKRDAGLIDVLTMQEFYDSLRSPGSIQIVFEVGP